MAWQEGHQHEAGKVIGQYANYLEIGHNEHEFLFAFGQSYQEEDYLRVHTRIVTGPVYAKAFLKLLHEALAQYEERFGTINES